MTTSPVDKSSTSPVDSRCAEHGHSPPPSAKPGTVTKCRRCRRSVRVPGAAPRRDDELRARLRQAVEEGSRLRKQRDEARKAWRYFWHMSHEPWRKDHPEWAPPEP